MYVVSKVKNINDFFDFFQFKNGVVILVLSGYFIKYTYHLFPFKLESVVFYSFCMVDMKFCKKNA